MHFIFFYFFTIQKSAFSEKKNKAMLTAVFFKHANIRYLKTTYKCAGNFHFEEKFYLKRRENRSAYVNPNNVE